MPRPLQCLCAIGLGLISLPQLAAQSTLGQPYSSQLASDPQVGNVQGTQRYGRPLKTDPDQGSGYSYHVYPVAHQNGPGLLQVQAATAILARQNLERQLANASDEARPLIEAQIQGLETQAALGTLGVPFVGPASPYGGTFDATAGLRNYATPLGAPQALNDPQAAQAAIRAQALGLGVNGDAQALVDIYHQPLIQIKLRVVEVSRNDGLQVNSVLEYVARDDVDASLTSGSPLNNAFENSRAATNFDINGLIDALGSGSGGLVNLTGEHINWAVSFLATEFNGDVITAPEVVTLNGQNVEFVAGSKLPFQLGQNVIQGTNNNIQQVFYKNVGTYVSVTPKIVNWGFNAEGRGEAPLVATEVGNWNRLIEWMLDEENFNLSTELRTSIAPFANNERVVPFRLKESILAYLDDFSRSELISYEAVNDFGEVVIARPDWVAEDVIIDCEHCQDWKPENCTIDLALVVRLSEEGTDTVNVDIGGPNPVEINANTEQNVRAIANVIQIKSGEGVVMAGLIGEREEEVLNKIPILGDLPYVGFPFRSKSTTRQKTELLIFLEAAVLDRRPEVAKAQSVHDFQLGRAYVEGELLDNPLECGMYRAGFGTYLPPLRKGEELYWTRHHRKIRKIATHLDDIRE
ncbi:MAG: hypothetical protein AAGD07_10890 [Planctomycetota bacterium]